MGHTDAVAYDPSARDGAGTSPFEWGGKQTALCVPRDVTIRRRILVGQKCPSHGRFPGPRRRGAASWLTFLFRVHGFRGKARFVLIFCCRCEGLHTIEKGTSMELFSEPISIG